jgi:release factor glutamine methyltransferase
VFYRAIADFGIAHLSKEGTLYFEIHHEGVDAITAILRNTGYGNIEARKDLYGNFRMIKAELIR